MYRICVIISGLLASGALAGVSIPSLWYARSNGLFLNEHGVYSHAINSEAGVLSGIDFAGNGDLYALSAFSDRLVRVDVDTRVVTNIGSLGINNFEGDISFDPRNGHLYGISPTSGASPEYFFRIDLQTGAASELRQLGSGMSNSDGMAIDSDGVAWIMSNGSSVGSVRNSILYRYDIDRNVMIDSTDMGENFGFTGGMDFDPLTGALYYSASDGRVMNIDLDTLQAEHVFDIAFPPSGTMMVHGLAIIPAPAGVFVLLPVGVIVARRRRVGN